MPYGDKDLVQLWFTYGLLPVNAWWLQTITWMNVDFRLFPSMPVQFCRKCTRYADKNYDLMKFPKFFLCVNEMPQPTGWMGSSGWIFCLHFTDLVLVDIFGAADIEVFCSVLMLFTVKNKNYLWLNCVSKRIKYGVRTQMISSQSFGPSRILSPLH